MSQVAHPSDPAHEGGAGGGDPLQVGDGKGARRRELGDRCFATVGNLGERRNGGKHALDHRSSFSSFRAFGPGAGRLSDRVDPRGREQGLEIASVTGNARARGLRPGEDFAILRLLLVDQRTRDVQDGFHAFAERRQRFGKSRGPLRDWDEPGGERVERLGELLSSHQSRVPPVGERAGAAFELQQRVLDSSEPLGTEHGTVDRLSAGVCQGDQVPGEVAAVHGGDVSRLERSPLASFVPVVEVATEALQTFHRLESRFETVDEVHRAEPAEVAGGDRRQQIHA